MVLFGELLPERALAEAQELAMTADLMLCVGSSLEVYPVAGLPAITRGAGGRIVLITQGPTPYDDDAELRLDGDVVDELERVLAVLRLIVIPGRHSSADDRRLSTTPPACPPALRGARRPGARRGRGRSGRPGPGRRRLTAR